MKLLAWGSLIALLLTGCCSYTEIARFESPILTDDGERPIATFMTANVSYQLFGCLPLTTGRPWTSGPIEEGNSTGIGFFKDQATLDNNLVSLRSALRSVGSDRVCNLASLVEDERMWSLFLINRHIVRTTCTILEPTK